MSRARTNVLLGICVFACAFGSVSPTATVSSCVGNQSRLADTKAPPLVTTISTVLSTCSWWLSYPCPACPVLALIHRHSHFMFMMPTSTVAGSILHNPVSASPCCLIVSPIRSRVDPTHLCCHHHHHASAHPHSSCYSYIPCRLKGCCNEKG